MKVLLLILLSIGCISAKRFAIMAPNVFHIGVNEQVSIAVFDAGNPVNVKLYLQDYPHRQKTFSQVHGQVKPDQGHLFLSVKVEPENLPDIASVDKQYVYLVAKSDDAHYQFHKEAKILLSYSDGMVFIQTDKPIYTPKQKVEIRVIPLEFDMKPSRKQITVVVENPQGIRVRQWKNLDTRTGIISKRIRLDENILLGNWTITALYGHRDIHNTSVKFEVTEYVLPKFSVKLSVPSFIMKTDNDFRIYIAARYTFGKPVLGNARVNLDIVGMNGTTFPFARSVITLDRSGNTTLTVKVQIIKDLPGKIWFPEKSRLQVQVEVVERATGSKESAVDNSCLFTSSPYLVEFRNTPNYFKPGFPFRAKAVVTHPNKKPAVGVRVLMAANFTRGKDKSMEVNQKFDRDDPNSMGHTDLNGEVDFAINTQSNYHLIIIKVKTDDDRLEEKYNGVANKIVKAFNTNGPFIMIRQNVTKGSVKVYDKMECEIFHSEQVGAVSPKKLSFAVVSRGRILSHDTAIALNSGKSKTWQFYVTPQMSPSARLIGYYIDSNGNVVADSILLDVEDSLPTKVEFHKPGKDLHIDTTAAARLGVVIVDESVYLLRDKNRLTKERIFKAAEDLDLGCGVGGGKDSKDIFKNAGVVLMTDNFVSGARRDYGCSEDESRKKRSVSEDDLEEKLCCNMARDTDNVTCVRLAFDSNKYLSYRCKNAFWKCCIELHGEEEEKICCDIARDTDNVTCARLGFHSDQDLSYRCKNAFRKCCIELHGEEAHLGRRIVGFLSVEELEDSKRRSQGRKYFPEAWFHEEFDVGSNGLFSQTTTLPGTITTWVMQAVAINNQTGLGLATPLRIVSEKNFFVTLKMPYSVKRGEQVSLVATVFNYDIMFDQAVKLYLKGDKDFCSIASDNKYAFIGIINVPFNDARSVTVPIIPKIVGEVNVEVMAIGTVPEIGVTFDMDAAVRKRLLVVPEGKEHRKSQSLVLDPSASLRRKGPLHVVEFSIDLESHKDAVPGSVRAFVFLTEKGDKVKGRTLDLRVKLASEMDSNWKPPAIHITKENGLLRRQFDVTRFLGGKLNVTAEGTGIALLEVDIRYNLPTTRDEICKFDVTTTVKETKQQNPGQLFGPVQVKQRNTKGRVKSRKWKQRKKGKKRPPVKSIQLKVCARYKERRNTSMCVMDIGIFTGFKPDLRSVRKLIDNLTELDKLEVSDRSLVIYLDQIPNDRDLCVDVQFDPEYNAGVVQAVPINVYDYYEPDESCTKFYVPDKNSPLTLGVCDGGSCKCVNDPCAQEDPPIGNISKLTDMACLNYNYAIKGRVLLIDQNKNMVEYLVRVLKIIKKRNRKLKVGKVLTLWKHRDCNSPDLQERNEYLFMGLKKGGRYELDKNSFVKLWPKSRANKDKKSLDKFVKQFAC